MTLESEERLFNMIKMVTEMVENLESRIQILYTLHDLNAGLLAKLAGNLSGTPYEVSEEWMKAHVENCERTMLKRSGVEVAEDH